MWSVIIDLSVFHVFTHFCNCRPLSVSTLLPIVFEDLVFEDRVEDLKCNCNHENWSKIEPSILHRCSTEHYSRHTCKSVCMQVEFPKKNAQNSLLSCQHFSLVDLWRSKNNETRQTQIYHHFNRSGFCVSYVNKNIRNLKYHKSMDFHSEIRLQANFMSFSLTIQPTNDTFAHNPIKFSI